MPSVDQLISKIKRPPSLPNWVTLNHRKRSDTARAITKFIVSRPKHALAKIYEIVADYVTFGTSLDTAMKSVGLIPNLLVRKAGKEIMPVLLAWIDERKLKGIRVFHDLKILYPIGRGMVVPVKPTFVFNSEGKLTPLFVIGWASNRLTDFQKRLLSTIIYHALLTLEEFVGSDAYVVTVPRHKGSKSERWVRYWKVSDYKFLDDDELAEQFEKFGGAIDDVIPILEELSKRGT